MLLPRPLPRLPGTAAVPAAKLCAHRLRFMLTVTCNASGLTGAFAIHALSNVDGTVLFIERPHQAPYPPNPLLTVPLPAHMSV